MKRILNIILSILFGSLSLYIIVVVVKTNRVYNNANTSAVTIDESYFQSYLGNIGIDSANVIKSYIIEKKDTVITFANDNLVGFLWSLSDQNVFDLNNIEIHSKTSFKDDNGTYLNFASARPSLRFSYRKNNNINLGEKPRIYLLNSENFEFKSDNQNKYLILYNQKAIKFTNKKDQLVYRLDFEKSSNIYLLKLGNVLHIIVIQNEHLKS